MFRRSVKVKSKGFKKYKGAPKEILKQIVDNCYNKKHNFFQTSLGHFSEFYTRDFAFCVSSLMQLDYKKECISTLKYALGSFGKHNRITTAINPENVPFDFPYPAADSLPLLLYSLRTAKAFDVVDGYRDFIISKTKEYISCFIDPKTGLIKKNIHVSSIKDHAKRSSSCYDNCMLFLLQKELDNLRLPNPLDKFDYKELIIQNFWNGSYFFDDTRKLDYVAGDANVFPFWTGLIEDSDIFASCLRSIKKAGLDSPFPLKYTTKKYHKFHFADLLAPNYEVNSIWMHLGLIYIEVLKKFRHGDFNKHVQTYLDLVKLHSNFLEVFTSKGKPYRSLFYISDESMLWSAILLDFTR